MLNVFVIVSEKHFLQDVGLNYEQTITQRCNRAILIGSKETKHSQHFVVLIVSVREEYGSVKLC